jgi:hypothetical protein
LKFWGVTPKEVISEAEFKRYMALFQGPLVDKSIDTIRVATKLVDADVAKASAALVPAELASQVEASS